MPIKEKRRLEVLLETHEIITITARRGCLGTILCRICGIDTLHLSISEAASVLRSSEATVFQFVQANQIHWVENAAGSLLICGDSLVIIQHRTTKLGS